MLRRPENQAVSATDPIALSAKRVRRLDILVQLRKVYRNLIRAEGLLGLPSPVYQPAGAAFGASSAAASVSIHLPRHTAVCCPQVDLTATPFLGHWHLGRALQLDVA